MQRLLQAAAAQVVTAEPVAVDLLRRFAGVWLEDSTVIRLPTYFGHLWPASGGCNGQSKAALKLYVEWDLASGRLVGPQCVPGRQSDHRSRLADVVPRGGIRVADMGYFDLPRLAGLDRRGVYWITRIQPHTILYGQDGRRCDVGHLMGHSSDPFDRAVLLGNDERLACRLIAFRVPQHVVRQRLKRLQKDAVRRGRAISERQRQWCRWTVVVTNVPAEKLAPKRPWCCSRCGGKSSSCSNVGRVSGMSTKAAVPIRGISSSRFTPN